MLRFPGSPVSGLDPCADCTSSGRPHQELANRDRADQAPVGVGDDHRVVQLVGRALHRQLGQRGDVDRILDDQRGTPRQIFGGLPLEQVIADRPAGPEVVVLPRDQTDGPLIADDHQVIEAWLAPELAVHVLAPLLPLADRRAANHQRPDRLVEVGFAVVELTHHPPQLGPHFRRRLGGQADGTGEQEPLRVADAEAGERLQLLPGFDALRDQRGVDAGREGDQRLHEVLFVGMAVDVARQRHIQLHEVGRAGDQRDQT